MGGKKNNNLQIKIKFQKWEKFQKSKLNLSKKGIMGCHWVDDLSLQEEGKQGWWDFCGGRGQKDKETLSV